MKPASPILSAFRRAPAKRTMREMLHDMRPISGGAPAPKLNPEVQELLDQLATAEDDTARESILETLNAKLAELSDEDLTAVEEKIKEHITAKGEEDSDEALAEMKAASEVLKATRAVQGTREEAATARQAERDAILAETNPEDPPAEEDDTAAPAETTETTTETTETTETTPAEPAAQPEAVAASVPKPSQTQPRKPKPHKAEKTHEPRALVAAGNPDFPMGHRLNSVEEMGEAFAARLESLVASSRAARGKKGKSSLSPDRYPGITIQADYPEDRFLSEDDSVVTNMAKVREVTRQITTEGIQAAGGLCAPVPTRYDLDVMAVDDRPIRDQALVRFGADRGGIKVLAPITISDVSGAVGTWTVAQDEEAATDAEVRKECARVDCPTPTEVFVQAIYKCLTVGVFNRRYFAELFAEWWQTAAALHARTAEDFLFDRLVALSTPNTTAEVYGATRDILFNLRMAADGIVSRQRLSPNQAFTVVLPAWVQGLLQGDLLRQQPGDGTTNVTLAEINAHFANRNLNPVWTPDEQIFGADPGGPLNTYPDTTIGVIYPTGTFIHLDGGEYDLGTEITDSTLIRANDIEAFSETFENVAKVGPESRVLTMSTCPSGQSQIGTDESAAACTVVVS